MIEQIVSELSGICKGKGQVVFVENIIFYYEYFIEVEFEIKFLLLVKLVRECKSLVNLVCFCINESFIM